MLIRMYDKSPSARDVSRVVETLRGGGVVVFPTGGVYAYGCSVESTEGVTKMIRLSGKSVESLSLVFPSISMISDYCKVDNSTFRILKRNLPSSTTFILSALSRVPSKILSRRKYIGVRIPDSAIATAIAEELGCPILASTVKTDQEDTAYITCPELIEEQMGNNVDMVIDGGEGGTEPSTVVDISSDEAQIIRQGATQVEL